MYGQMIKHWAIIFILQIGRSKGENEREIRETKQCLSKGRWSMNSIIIGCGTNRVIIL
jgi:hypothetical protein